MVLSVLVGLINLFNLTFCLLAAPKLYYLYCSSVLSGSHFQSRVLNEAKNLCRIFYDGIIQITRWMFAVQLHLLLCHCCYTMMLLLAACDIKFTLTVCHSLSSLTVVIKTKVWISVLVCTNNAAVPSCPTITPLLSGVSCLSQWASELYWVMLVVPAVSPGSAPKQTVLHKLLNSLPVDFSFVYKLAFI